MAVNKTVDVEREYEKERNRLMLVLSLLVRPALSAIGCFAYKNGPQPVRDEAAIKPAKPFNCTAKAISLLNDSKKAFGNKEYKDAYGIAWQSLRLRINKRSAAAF